MEGEKSPNDEAERQLVQTGIWSFTLVMALVLEQFSGAAAVLLRAQRRGTEVLGAVGVLGVVFLILLAAVAGIIVLHYRWHISYGYHYFVVDTVFIAVPLFVASRFIDVSTFITEEGTRTTSLDEATFSAGLWLVLFAFAAFVLRDFFTRRALSDLDRRNEFYSIVAVHVVGGLLALSMALSPGLVGPLVIVAFFVVVAFFGGMAASLFVGNGAQGESQPAPGSPVP